MTMFFVCMYWLDMILLGQLLFLAQQEDLQQVKCTAPPPPHPHTHNSNKAKHFGGGGIVKKKIILINLCCKTYLTHLGPLHKTFTGEKNRAKSKNSGNHEFTLGRKLRLK